MQIRYPAPLSKGAAFCLYLVKTKEQNASRFGICAGFRLGARDRSLGRNDAESLGFGRNEQPWPNTPLLPQPLFFMLFFFGILHKMGYNLSHCCLL